MINSGALVCLNHIDTVDNIGGSVAAIERFTVAGKPYVSYASMWLRNIVGTT